MGWRQEILVTGTANRRTDHHAPVHGLYGLGDASAAQPSPGPLPVHVQVLCADGGKAGCDDLTPDQTDLKVSPQLQPCCRGIHVGGCACKSFYSCSPLYFLSADFASTTPPLTTIFLWFFFLLEFTATPQCLAHVGFVYLHGHEGERWIHWTNLHWNSKDWSRRRCRGL